MDVLEGPNGLVEDEKDMLDIAVSFYKELFAAEESAGVSLGENFWSESDKVTNEENEMLTASFTEEEIKEAIFICYPEGAPGPDGLPFFFTRNFGKW